MNISSAPRQHRAFFWLLSLGIIGIGIWSLAILRDTSHRYDSVRALENTINTGSVAKADIPGSDKTLNIPNWRLFAPGNMLSLVSKQHPLPSGFKTPTLINTSVAHGDSGTAMQVQSQVEQPLRSLYTAAEKDGVELMLSSAYRSIDDQTKLYNDFVTKQGAEMAARYVAKPGSSEHHTGLAVDFATASGPCQANSDSCSLAVADAEWLQENAPKFGFIQRYPEGKQPITGVSFEPWHYRYVGVPMALAVSQSSLTYDEVVRQIAPGYAK